MRLRASDMQPIWLSATVSHRSLPRVNNGLYGLIVIAIALSGSTIADRRASPNHSFAPGIGPHNTADALGDSYGDIQIDSATNRVVWHSKSGLILTRWGVVSMPGHRRALDSVNLLARKHSDELGLFYGQDWLKRGTDLVVSPRLWQFDRGKKQGLYVLRAKDSTAMPLMGIKVADMIGNPVVSPTGNHILFQSVVDPSNRSDVGKGVLSALWVTTPAGHGTRKLLETRYLRNPVWNPRGTHFLLEYDPPGSRGGLFLIDADTGIVRKILAAEIPQIRVKGVRYQLLPTVTDQCWSPSGRHIVIRVSRPPERTSFLAIIDVSSLKIRIEALLVANNRDLDSPSWSPDGSMIAMRTIGGVVVWDVRTKIVRQLKCFPTRYGWYSDSPSWSPDSKWIACAIAADNVTAVEVLVAPSSGKSKVIRMPVAKRQATQ